MAFSPSSGLAQKRALRLEIAIEWMQAKHGYEHLGVLTMTFIENLTDWEEAERRFASFEKNVLSEFCKDWCLVVEFQARGAIHYHLVVALPLDIRTGCNLDVIKDKRLPRWIRYGKAAVSENLRHYWEVICQRAQGRAKVDGRFQEVSKGYGFGRVELLPLIKSPEAVSSYLSEYLKPRGANVYRCKKRLRFSRTITAWLRGDFRPCSFGGYVWRKKLSLVARDFGCSEFGEFVSGGDDKNPGVGHWQGGFMGLFGSGWFYLLRDAIRLCPLEMSRDDWKLGRAEKVFERLTKEVWESELEVGLRLQDPKWVAYQEAKAAVWRRLRRRCRNVESCGEVELENGDPDWDVPFFDPPAEWQLQFNLQRWERGEA